MTLRFSSNNYITTVAEGYFAIKQFMKSASPTGPGWSVKMSGTGTSGVYNATGDSISSASLFGDKSWFVLKAPSGGREILYHVRPTNSTALIMYSKSAGFTGGSADVRPTATDETCLFGQYIGDVFSHLILLYNTTGSMPTYMNFWADDSGEYANGWWLKRLGEKFFDCGFFMDEIIDYNVNDIDRVVFSVQGGNSGAAWDYNSLSGAEGTVDNVYGYGCASWLKLSNNEDYFGKISIISPSDISSNRMYRGSFGKNYNNKTVLMQMVYFNGILQNSSHYYKRRPYYKGVGKYLKWNQEESGLSLGTMISINSIRDHIAYSSVIFPWDGGYLKG